MVWYNTSLLKVQPKFTKLIVPTKKIIFFDILNYFFLQKIVIRIRQVAYHHESKDLFTPILFNL